MRAILIDPEKRTLTEIQLTNGDDYEEIQKVLRCRSYTTGAQLSGSLLEGFEAIYVSDDPLEERDDPRFWFQVDAERDSPSSYPIAGLGLAQRIDPEGAACDVRIAVEELRARITFTQRKFRGLTTTEHEQGLVVGLHAPIIDGTDEEEDRQSGA